MSEHYEALREKLQELFQMDQANLDFGIYRIMNTKREEITRYLDHELPSQVEGILRPLIVGDTAKIKKQIRRIEEDARRFEGDPERDPEYRDLVKRLSDNTNVASIEKEIFSDLYTFFSRYYEDGDFLSRRRYKEGVYAIPYEGEEVKLHWANSDQYYIKTAEYFSNYSFHLAPSGKIVHFRIKNGSTEQNNNKEANGKERRFLLLEESPVSFDDRELVICFQYQADAKGRKQEEINATIVETLRAEILLKDFTELFSYADNGKDKVKAGNNGNSKSTDKSPSKCLLEKHLHRYTARNQFDYFIHKDLGGFLRRELDFFLKNEVLLLGDILTGDENITTRRIMKLRTIKQIADKIICFLAQLEDFQKRLWLKKKFVVETNWCITLDRVSEELYEEIVINEAQREEWVKLFAIDEIRNDLAGGVDYSTPLTKSFLQVNPHLVLDTAFFTEDFKQRLVSSIDDLDKQTDGLLIHSENFQALNLLQEKYQESIQTTYIDPPYNSPSSEIIYKNSYKHSSWLTLMSNRIDTSKIMQTDDGVLIVAIDKNENDNLVFLLKDLYPDSVYEKNTIVVRHNTKGIQGGFVSINNEYAITISPLGVNSIEKKIDKKNWKYDNFRNWGGESERDTAKNCFYPIYVKGTEIVGFGEVCDEEHHPNFNEEDERDGTIAVYPIDKEGIERKWTYARNSVERINHLLRVKIFSKTEDNENRVFVDIEKCRDKERYKTVWDESKYIAGDYGSKILNNIMGSKKFDFPKSIHTVEDCIRLADSKNAIILDYFAGSATTGHAVINLNREDEGTRKYILVEMGEYFDSVTKPRMQKVIYSKDWKNGKPLFRQGSSHAFKYIRLESYEDTLNNLTLQRDDAIDPIFKKNKQLHEQYLLSYMLEIESRESLLSLSRFYRPFDYQLAITNSGETHKTTIDMVETFNYLLGLTVSQQSHIRAFAAEFLRDEHGKLRLKGDLKESENGRFLYRIVKGKTRTDEQVLVIWRSRNSAVEQITDDMLEEDDVALNAFLRTLAPELPYASIYVNGDNTLMNNRKDTEHWQVRLIEEAFHLSMFSQTTR